ncbi:hypothetical protein EON65_12425 [archaeon]|nr:MAG: hypothetical protein EON65_12425 [archaeon]
MVHGLWCMMLLYGAMVDDDNVTCMVYCVCDDAWYGDDCIKTWCMIMMMMFNINPTYRGPLGCIRRRCRRGRRSRQRRPR